MVKRKVVRREPLATILRAQKQSPRPTVAWTRTKDNADTNVAEEEGDASRGQVSLAPKHQLLPSSVTVHRQTHKNTWVRNNERNAP